MRFGLTGWQTVCRLQMNSPRARMGVCSRAVLNRQDYVLSTEGSFLGGARFRFPALRPVDRVKQPCEARGHW
jgi:hypothetical protein